MTHTPAPWAATADPYPDGTPYFRFQAGDDFAEGDAMGFNFTAIMREADAQLIAAAPDLLAALKAAEREIHNPGHARANGIDLPEMVEAAIDKAVKKRRAP